MVQIRPHSRARALARIDFGYLEPRPEGHFKRVDQGATQFPLINLPTQLFETGRHFGIETRGTNACMGIRSESNRSML